MARGWQHEWGVSVCRCIPGERGRDGGGADDRPRGRGHPRLALGAGWRGGGDRRAWRRSWRRSGRRCTRCRSTPSASSSASSCSCSGCSGYARRSCARAASRRSTTRTRSSPGARDARRGGRNVARRARLVRVRPLFQGGAPRGPGGRVHRRHLRQCPGQRPARRGRRRSRARHRGRRLACSSGHRSAAFPRTR